MMDKKTIELSLKSIKENGAMYVCLDGLPQAEVVSKAVIEIGRFVQQVCAEHCLTVSGLGLDLKTHVIEVKFKPEKDGPCPT